MKSLRKALEYIHLFLIKFLFQINAVIEFLQVAFRYYGLRSFMKIDFYLMYQYLFVSPYKINKKFLMKKGEKEQHTYGETPLTTLELITKECVITSKDKVYELGSGRGRGCFWLHSALNCKVVGIEWVMEFVENCNRVRDKFRLNDIEFRCEDFSQTNYSDATVIYLYGTCLVEKTIDQLIKKFEKLSPGTKIITTSYSLNDYTEKPMFEIMKCFPAKFPWGTADIYLHVITQEV